MRTLYITTARFGLDEETLKRDPYAGGIFIAVPGATGIPINMFR